MIDFATDSTFKLTPASTRDARSVEPLLIHGEELIHAFKSVRDLVVFTNKRIIAVDVQGMTGKKKDFTSLPYSKVQVFSVETAGTFDMDAELELWFSAVGKVRFEFRSGADIRQISQMIATYVL
ncbi:PH domain-containing protein [Kineosporia babensis]|uniref:PH domain-containing protein n=1 Tax=Kineosporia babensis TaxID=499548 RepID=A0A9X1NAN0_9ACTN|nr:PH domain-containing protein [Kineosporia babensis]MCD5310610.1 PH domain-containing protein [Kineosporia babensis]